MIIAIDGTCGSGKSTIAKELAKKLDFGFFSAGALYRAITVKVLNLGINENDDDKLKHLIESTKIVYSYDENSKQNTMIVDGINITEKLGTEEVSNFVAKISVKPYIREFVRELQKNTSLHNENIVMEGRDIGSVIFPNADLKVFVDCEIETRAKRRMKDYEKLGDHVTLDHVIADLKERDYRDMHREISPLIMCENSLLIDTSLSSVEECLETILKSMLERKLIDNEFLALRGIILSKPND